ncbi:uncharacterized protein N7525_003678 [Penicillium rubens]|uniref:uncharacterized protein n=1 Tax=Penicillium rubens TaxID=1108849 RepID=UPI002A5A29B3|nr:uncharacterized protein N7525_003678 [Penicillium rubens]KAJ5838490.1 hypothetical protein N7525_003678 [Penicillium rubens]KAJ5866541.1 hypothetical protein N7534_001094 [Penicillium rubens]
MSWDWRSTLMTLIALFISPRFFCARVRACWRRLLSETDPRRTLDLEQNTDGQEHELDGLAMVISKTNYKPLSNRRLGS